ncbi:TonB-dependent receptor [Helicobacter pametensis]|uniref:TonB-dependent receptor n=1 Tax=Helicobacter pametensis TaxID=95149 RepID=UPI0004859194|nr:TonB-dependent receptor [Helicobacter pametensis]
MKKLCNFSLLVSSLIASDTLEMIEIKAPQYKSKAQASQSSQTLKSFVIEKNSWNSTSSLGNFFPNLKIYPQGSDTFPMITLRGVTGPDYYSYVLGLYVDGVPQSPNIMIQTLGDVESIRLVNGAEGLFYGENAPLGLIEIETKSPLSGNYVYVSTMVSFLQEDLEGHIGWNLIPNRLWGKANVRYIHDNGYLKDPQTQKMLNDGDSVLAGATLYYLPTESFLISAHYGYYFTLTHKDFFLSKSQFDSLKFETGEQISGYEEYQSGIQNKIFNKNPFNRLEAHNAHLKMEYFLPDSTLTSISAFQKTDTLGNSYPGIFVQNESKDGNYYNTLQFIQELKLHTTYSHGIESIFGAYYKFFSLDNGMDNVPTGSASGGADGTGEPPLYYNGTWRAIETVNTAALYADVFIPYQNWSFNLGLRYQFFHSSIDTPLPPMMPLMQPYKDSAFFHAINPRINIAYHFTQNHQIFLQLSNSSKPGGFSKFPFADTDTIPYKQEQIYSLELGNRSMFFNTLSFHTSFYGILRTNTQAYVGEGYNKSITNIGKSYAFGLDAEIGYSNVFLSSFINANLGYSGFANDAKNKGELIIGGNASHYDVRGLRTRFSPLFSFSAGLDLYLLKKQDHRLTLANLLTFSTSYFLDDFNRETDLIQKAFAIWNLSLIYEFFKHYELTLFAQNLTNSRYATSVLWDGNGKAYSAGNPINIGIKFAYRY